MSLELFFDDLLEKLSSFHQITTSFSQKLKTMLIVRKFSRGDVLLKAGHRSAHLWYLVEGFAKEVGHDEDYERTSWFYFPGDFMYSYPSFFSQLPAFRDIEMITECTIVQISYKELITLRHDFEEVNFIFDLARSHCETQRAKHASDISSFSARKRYEKFYQSHKALFNVARHKDIASFLGIKSDGFRRYNH